MRLGGGTNDDEKKTDDLRNERTNFFFRYPHPSHEPKPYALFSIYLSIYYIPLYNTGQDRQDGIFLVHTPYWNLRKKPINGKGVLQDRRIDDGVVYNRDMKFPSIRGVIVGRGSSVVPILYRSPLCYPYYKYTQISGYIH